MASVKQFLTKNKIFFETITATMLAVMAMVVSIAQPCTARKQTDLQDLQTHLAEAQALPQFEIRFMQVFDASVQRYRTNSVTVANRGGAIHDVVITTAEFFRLEAARTFGEQTAVELPLNGYFSAQYSSASPVGELATLVGDGNNDKESQLERAVSTLAKQQNWAYANLDVRIILRIAYSDILNRQHIDFFEVRPVSGGTRISDADGAALFKRWRTLQGIVELSEVTPQRLLAAIPPSAKH